MFFCLAKLEEITVGLDLFANASKERNILYQENKGEV
jgi:hypothetical protein